MRELLTLLHNAIKVTPKGGYWGKSHGNRMGLEGWCRIMFTVYALTVLIILFKLKNKLDFVNLKYCQAQSLFYHL